MMDNTPARIQQEGQQLERYVGPKSWPELIRQAETLYRSGLLPKSVRSAEAAIAIIQTGRELQLNPMEAFRAIHVIEGTPTVSPRCKLGLIWRSGLLVDYRITEGDTWAECTMKRKGLPSPVTVRFTMDEAKAAGLVGKDNWRKWPRNMLRWRAIGYVADQLFADITGGHFTPDELGAETDADGAAIEPPEPSAVGEQRVQHMQRVHEVWQSALASGWSEADLGRFFARLGARKKSEITGEQLEELQREMERKEVEAAQTVEAVDWRNDPALEGI